MMTLQLEEKNAKELLTFLLNQKAWLEGAIRREKDALRKVRYENTLNIINPIITRLEESLREANEGKKPENLEFKMFVVFCNKCKQKTNVLARGESEIKNYWRCSCGSENFTILGEERR